MDMHNVSAISNKIETTEKHCKISTFRNYASQIYAAFATNIIKFTTGSFFGFTSVIIAELYKKDAEISASVADLSWFSSYCFMSPVGCLALSTLAQCIGNRLVMLISAIFCAMSYLIFYFSTNSQMLLGAQAIVGLFLRSSFGPGMTYVVEITQPQLRSALTATTALSTMTASFSVVFLSNFLHWRTIALVMLIFPIVGFIAVCTIPESPHWLASRNEFVKAETALRWLRGWSDAKNIAPELNTLKETYTSSACKPNCMSTERRSSWLKSVKNNINSYHHRSFYIPLSMICILFILHNCAGTSPLIGYSIVIFGHINAPIDAHVAASIFDAMRIVGAIFCICLIHYTGKKKLMYVTLTGAGLTNITSATALLLKEYQIYPETCQWVAAVAMMFTTFFMSAGIDKIVYILNAEVFPTKYRNLGTGIGLFAAAVAEAISNKLFLPLMNAVTLSGVFIIYGVTCIVTCTLFHFMFPETEGKTLQEIEQHFEKKVKISDKVSIAAS